MPQFIPIAIPSPEGLYVTYKLVSHHRDFVEVRTDLESAEVENEAAARSWFKSKIADFFGVTEENLTPLWLWMLPKQLQQAVLDQHHEPCV